MKKYKRINISKMKPDYQTTIFNLFLDSGESICAYAQYNYICNFLKQQLSLGYEDRIAYIDIGYYQITDVCKRRFIMQELTAPRVHIVLSAPCSDSIFKELKAHIKANKNIIFFTDFTRTRKARRKKLIKFSTLSYRKCLLESKYDFKTNKHTFTDIT